MIEITHFVNPHVFFFRRLPDDGAEKAFRDMEAKLLGTVTKKVQPLSSSDEIEIGDVVAAYISKGNKWVRGQIKEQSKDGLFYLWAIDYGVPMVLKSSEIMKIPPIYAKMNSKVPRIHVGGLKNCVPSESLYDLETDANIMIDQLNWSQKSITIMQQAVRSAIALKFEDIEEAHLVNRTHSFGRLMCQRSKDGTWVDLNNALCTAFVAIAPADSWLNHLNRLESIRQPEWKTLDVIPLGVKFMISPVLPKKIKICQPSSDESQPNSQTSRSIANSDSEGVKSIKIANGSGQNSVSSVDQYQPSCSFVRTRPRLKIDYNNPNKLNDNRFPSSQRNLSIRGRGSQSHDRSGQFDRFPHGWHRNGNLKNQRYRDEVEFFEASFRKPTTPIEKYDSPTSSSEDEPNEKKMTAPTTTVERTETNLEKLDLNASPNEIADKASETGPKENETENSTVNDQKENEMKDVASEK